MECGNCALQFVYALMLCSPILLISKTSTSAKKLCFTDGLTLPFFVNKEIIAKIAFIPSTSIGLMGLNWKRVVLDGILVQNSSLWEWWGAGRACPEKLCILHSWKCSKLFGWCFDQLGLVEDVPAHGRELELDGFSLSIQTTLWFYLWYICLGKQGSLSLSPVVGPYSWSLCLCDTWENQEMSPLLYDTGEVLLTASTEGQRDCVDLQSSGILTGTEIPTMTSQNRIIL